MPSLVWERRRLPLGRHASHEVAAACYDVAKLLLVRKLGGDGEPLEGLKLHRPAAAYTSHPLWAQLAGAHCSFEEACSLLAGGAAEDLLAAPLGCRGMRHKQAAANGAAAGPQRGPELQSKRARQEQMESCTQCGASQPGGMHRSTGQQGLCTACSRAVPGPPAAGAATVQRSGRGTADADQSAQAPAAGQKQGQTPGSRQTSWSGLEPADCGVYCIRLPRSVTGGKCGVISAPIRYAQAVFGGGTGDPALPTSVTLILAADGRQFRCGLAFRSGYALSGLRPVLQALGVAAGDQLCFVPAGRGAATISLRRVGTEAGAAAGSSGVAVNAAAAGDAAGNKSGAAVLPQAERTGQQQALAALFGSDSE